MVRSLQPEGDFPWNLHSVDRKWWLANPFWHALNWKQYKNAISKAFIGIIGFWKYLLDSEAAACLREVGTEAPVRIIQQMNRLSMNYSILHT